MTDLPPTVWLCEESRFVCQATKAVETQGRMQRLGHETSEPYGKDSVSAAKETAGA